uniref:Uncharacterized protein n=1 Tax=Arundo donax TaxID=35708 RepID=A0A0A9GWF5_ARUDO
MQGKYHPYRLIIRKKMNNNNNAQDSSHNLLSFTKG